MHRVLIPFPILSLCYVHVSRAIIVAKGARNRHFAWQKGNKKEHSEDSHQLCARLVARYSAIPRYYSCNTTL